MATPSRSIASAFLVVLVLFYLRLESSVCGHLDDNAKVTPNVSARTILWKHSEAGVDIYRIPLVTYTPKGHLLAVAEARKNTTGDAGPKFVAIRRSKDALGDYWEPTQFIVDDGYLILDGLNLGNVIVDDETATIFIMYGTCLHHDKCAVASNKLIRSVDDGVTWSRPVNISEQIGTQIFSPGPGFGIQKKLAPNKGRLLSCGHGDEEKDGVYCLLSDDHGQTWRWGGSIKGIPYGGKKKMGDFVPDECQAVELSDGSIMINIRNQYRYKCSCRFVAHSYDGGETLPLKNVTLDEALIEPACAAGLLFHRDVVFFSNPKSRLMRIDMTLQWSYDNGTSWAGALQIWDKASGYSSMTAHPGPSPYVFIIYEKGNASSTESVEFVRISLYDE